MEDCVLGTRLYPEGTQTAAWRLHRDFVRMTCLKAQITWTFACTEYNNILDECRTLWGELERSPRGENCMY